MSVDSLTNRNDYTGNGAVDTYSYTFKIFDQTHLRVTVRDTEGAETLLVLTTDYTVTGVGEDAGGTVVLVDANQDWIDASGDLETDFILTIRRVLPILQETDIRNQGTYFPEDIENEFDKGVMVAQQQQDEIDRSVKLPETVLASGFDTVLPVPSASQIVGTNAGNTGFAFFEQVPATYPTTSKGDLIVHNGSVNTRLVVGTNDKILVADSGEATGVKWAYVASTIPSQNNGQVLMANDTATRGSEWSSDFILATQIFS